jgi:hypothetical protein
MLQVLVNISLEKFCCRKETWGYAKEKVKKVKTMGAKMPAMKRREIAPALANISSFNKRDVFKDHSRIRLATKYSTHMHILI